MPKLDKKFIEEMRVKLLKEKEEIKEELNTFSETVKNDVFGTQDEDNATEMSDYEDRKVLVEELEKNLAKVEKALAKIEDKTYGLCEVCGKPIPKTRLKVFPAAERCIKDC